MTCKEFQMLLINDRPDRISQQQIRSLARHVETCRECRVFREQLNRLRQKLEKTRAARLPARLDRMTRQHCLAELRKIEPGPRYRGKRVPRLVYGALLALIVVTLILIFPVIGDLSLAPPLTPGKILAVGLILQNAVMLLLSPLLIRKYRPVQEVING